MSGQFCQALGAGVAGACTLKESLLRSARDQGLRLAEDPLVLHSCIYVAPVHISGLEVPVARPWIIFAYAVQHPKVLE